MNRGRRERTDPLDPLGRDRLRDRHGVVHIGYGGTATAVGLVLCGYHVHHDGEHVDKFARSGEPLDGVLCPLCLDVMRTPPSP